MARSKMTREHEEFYAKFDLPTVDLITVDYQLRNLKDRAMAALQRRYGKVIPKQTDAELLELFTDLLT